MNEFEHKLKSAEKLAARSSVSRRDFLQLAALAGLTIPAANALLLDSARAQEPKKGGNFIIGMEGGSASDSLDPSTYADSVMIAASLAICNNLVEFDEKGAPTGEIFESWEAKPGAAEKASIEAKAMATRRPRIAGPPRDSSRSSVPAITF